MVTAWKNISSASWQFLNGLHRIRFVFRQFISLTIGCTARQYVSKLCFTVLSAKRF
jgi:hypothetical protein